MTLPMRKRGPSPKLDESGERALIAAYSNPKLSPEDVAKMFNVSRATLYSIVARYRAHVDAPPPSPDPSA